MGHGLIPNLKYEEEKIRMDEEFLIWEREIRESELAYKFEFEREN